MKSDRNFTLILLFVISQYFLQLAKLILLISEMLNDNNAFGI